MNKKIIYTDYSDTILVRYFKDISKYKVLDADEINNLIVKAQAGDIKARNKVVQSNLKFVIAIAKQFQNRGIPLLDLIESGNEGLIYSINKFNPDKGVVFLSYAVWWIKQFIYKSIYWQSREIRLPISQEVIIHGMIEETNKFMQKYHRPPSTDELSKALNVDSKQIDYLYKYFNKMVSVDDFIKGDEDNSQICDIIPDTSVSLEDKVNSIFTQDEICKYLDKLSIREHDIIMLLYGIKVNPLHIKDIAVLFGIGEERVRQLKEKALTKLRKHSKKLKSLS